MKLHYKGKFNLDPESLPHNEHKPNAVAFKEPKDSKTLSIIANALSIVIFLVFVTLVYLRGKDHLMGKGVVFACLASILTLFPHEILHGICFKEDVYLYTNWKQFMLFVTGPESMTKGRFIFMSLLPNLVFGFIPFAVGMIFPSLSFLSLFGALCISMGAGDYINVFNAIAQMPKGARTYLHGFNSFWYFPEENS